jgi:hypothetical protein
LAYVDWTDTYKKDRANGPIIASRPTRTTVPQRGSNKGLKPSKPTATVSVRKSRRRSVTGTDNTRHNPGGNNMPVKTTRKSPAKTTTRRAAKAETVETLTLTLAKVPSGKGGFLYNDASDHDEKLHVTSMYLSQDAIAKMFGGDAPESLTISA